MGPSDRQTRGRPKFGAELGVLAMAVLCCGGQALVLGALGGLALGSVLGVGAGALAVVLGVVGFIVMRRRRAAACALPPEGRPSS